MEISRIRVGAVGSLHHALPVGSTAARANKASIARQPTALGKGKVVICRDNNAACAVKRIHTVDDLYLPFGPTVRLSPTEISASHTLSDVFNPAK